MRRAILAFAALATGCVASVAAAIAPIEWTISPARDAGWVQLTIATPSDGGRNTTSTPVSRAELEGIDASANGDRRHFTIRRQAGSLDCTGVFDGARGTGTCGFTADPAFAQALAARGIGRPTERQSLELTLHGADLRLVETLGRYGYARPTIDQLVAAGIFKVTPDYVQSLADAGFRVGSLDKLVTFRIHGIQTDWISALGHANPSLTHVPADQLVAMRIHGVAPAQVEAFGQLGYKDLTAQQLIAMRIHGVSPEFVRKMQERNGGHPDADQLVSMRILGDAYRN